MTHLFLFTLTPVQSFISQARKTQDLWAGSRMLSDLVKKVFAKIVVEKGKVIFPFSDIGDSLPNRILASFDFNKTNQELKDLGKKIADEVAVELYELTKKAESKIGETEYSKIKKAFETQLKDYFSTFWVFVPVENNNYVAAYEKADRLLGAVKNSRTFTQYPEQGRKCSLSGEQNALVFNQSTTKLKEKFINNCVLVDNDRIAEGEGLSAIAYIKRTYKNNEPPFPSTAKIALLKDLSIFSDSYLKNYEDLLGKNFDEQLYYEENLTAKYFEKHKLPLKNLDEAKKQLSNLNYIAKQQKRAFTKYYAILLFDADSMGAWLSGEFIEPSQRKIQLQDFHKHISSLLSGFADYAKNYVDGDKNGNGKKGRTVYAGGDDYLGFINLHYLFEVMKHLREQFKAQVSDKISNNGQFQILPNPQTNSDEMTFSAGISIAHYKTPLSEVLTWARKMEKEAKNTDNKDSFGIAVLKKSGEIHKAVLPFRETQTSYFSDKMQTITSSLNKKFSNKFITSFEQETYLIADSGSGKLNDDILDILEFEILRLTKRAKIEATDAELSNLQNSVNSLLKTSNKAKKALSFDSPIQNFTASLNVCDFINRKLQGND